MLIYLIGMPGAGKTTCGQSWSKQLGYKFYDLDVFIETVEGSTINRLFAQKGEQYFRQLEHDTLRQISQGTHRLIATGGGTPCFFDNIAFMKSKGLVIFLDPPLSHIHSRLQKQSQRPLFEQVTSPEQLFQTIDKLYQQRLPYYTQANLRLQRYSPHELPTSVKHEVSKQSS